MKDKRGHYQMRSPRLKGVECELCHELPLHFVLRFEKLGPLVQRSGQAF